MGDDWGQDLRSFKEPIVSGQRVQTRYCVLGSCSLVAGPVCKTGALSMRGSIPRLPTIYFSPELEGRASVRLSWNPGSGWWHSRDTQAAKSKFGTRSCAERRSLRIEI